MYVNYDNALNPSFHEHSDQTSFQLFAYEKYLLIDPGYKTSGYSNWARNGIHWLHSPYAHNLIIINPDSVNEVEHLAHDYNGDPNTSDSTNNTIPLQTKEPLFRKVVNPANPQTITVPNPSYKEYFIDNQQIEKLKIYMDYIIDPVEDDTIRVERNFYFLEKEYFVIMDNVHNTGADNSNTFWNTLHFRPYTYSNNNVSIDNDGIFSLYADDNVELHGVVGSSTPFYIGIDAEKPFGCYIYNYSHNYQHRRLKSVTEAVNTKYITILFPSESAGSPITNILDGDSYYAVEIYDTSKSPIEKSYYAVSDSLLDVSFTDIDINSDAGFVGLTYRPGYQFDTKITQFIMDDGDLLVYNDVDTLLLDSNSCIDEIICAYSGTELSVIIKSDDEFPQYRILRQGVDPEDFTSIGVANQGNGPSNIEHLSYDNNYFYVNWYDFSTSPVYLSSPIYVPNGDTLVISNGVTVNCMNSGIKIEIDGNISIGDSVTFTSPDSVHWDGIYLNKSNSEIEVEYLALNRGILNNHTEDLEISHSEFNSSGIYQAGITLTVSYTDFDSSNVECQWNSPFYLEDQCITIENCTFENYSDSVLYAIDISGYPMYSVTRNTITNCSGGINLNESGSEELCDISDNTIYTNSGNGIVLYHSYGDITGCNDIEENVIGIVSTHNSPLRVHGNDEEPYQTIKNNVYEEIKIDIDSAPEQEQMYLNRIIDESSSGGNDQYLINCIRFDRDARTIIVEDNYWGSESPEWEEWDGDELFYPDSAFDYIPVWEPKKDDPSTQAGILYRDADILVSQGKYQDAKAKYKSIINLYPTTAFAIYSMRNLLSVETIYSQDFLSLKQYYLTEPNCNINYERTKLSNYLANYCSIKMEEYAVAITFFEDIISNPDTELDSVYAVIDAGYTYLLMENSSMYYKGRMTELIPKSTRDFKKKRMELLAGLLEIPETITGGSTENYKFSLHQNYPNPFGRSTIISFSLPKNTQKANLKIYNIRGQLIRKLDINTKDGLGSIIWDGHDSNGKVIRNGVYFYKLTADKKVIIKKMVLIR